MKLIFISGPSGSGKTTLSNQIIEKIKNGIVLSTDNYYKTGLISKLLSKLIRGYFDKSIKVLIHLKIDESDPVTENEFSFEYELGSGEKIYDKFELNDLDPVTKDKIEKEVPLDIEYTTTITILYLGVELAPTTSELGTKVTRMQTA